MAEENTTQNNPPNINEKTQTETKTTKDATSTSLHETITGAADSSQSKSYTTLTPVDTTASTVAGNASGYILLINSSYANNANNATTTSKSPMYSNAMFLPQPVNVNLFNQAQGGMLTTKPNNTNDVVGKAMDLSNLNDMEDSDSNQHPMTNAALTLVSLGSTVSQPVQEIVIDESGRSSFATNSNLPGVSVTVESEGTVPFVAPKSQAEPSGSGMTNVDPQVENAKQKSLVVMREVLTQTGGGQGEVVILKSMEKEKSRTLSSYLTEQSLERKRRAEMKLDETQKLASDKHRTHACDKCDKKFFTKHDLKRHLIVHTDERPFSCPHCNKGFRTRNEVNLHIPVHNKTTQYRCEFCGKEFRTKGCFKSHIKYHIGDKRHKCTICGRAFVKSADLKRHVAGHNNEKNHKCEECGSSFTRRDNLKAHMLLHSRESVVTCDKCNKEFINAVYLKRHMHVHQQAKKKPYECQWCPKTYEQLEGLRRHIRQHVGDEKFVCQQCNKKFMTEIQLKRHLWLSHEQTSPYRKSVL